MPPMIKVITMELSIGQGSSPKWMEKPTPGIISKAMSTKSAPMILAISLKWIMLNEKVFLRKP